MFADVNHIWGNYIWVIKFKWFWSERHLLWFGHVCRMSSEHIPRALLYRELATGMRNRGRASLTSARKTCYLNRYTIQCGRPLPRSAPIGGQRCVRACIHVAEASLIALMEEKRARRKGRRAEEQESTSSSHEDRRSPFIATTSFKYINVFLFVKYGCYFVNLNCKY